jgi:protein phosphatase
MVRVEQAVQVGNRLEGVVEAAVEQVDEIADEPTTEREGRARRTPPIEAVGATHPGRVRQRNEDAFDIVLDQGLAMVADGLGGHPAGDIASRMAVQEVAEHMRELDPDPTQPNLNDADALPHASIALLRRSVQQANAAIHAAGHRYPVVSGMGTTFAALLIVRAHAIIVHVGDSRVYRLRDGELSALTEDDSMAAEYLRALGDHADPEVVRQHEGTLTRCLGAFADVQVTVRTERRLAGDLFLLCSDGLWTTIPHAILRRILVETPDLSQAVERLVAEANAAGGPDNITAVLVRPLQGDGAGPSSGPASTANPASISTSPPRPG